MLIRLMLLSAEGPKLLHQVLGRCFKAQDPKRAAHELLKFYEITSYKMKLCDVQYFAGDLRITYLVKTRQAGTAEWNSTPEPWVLKEFQASMERSEVVGLMRGRFTASEARLVAEAIWGKKLEPSNWRKVINSLEYERKLVVDGTKPTKTRSAAAYVYAG